MPSQGLPRCVAGKGNQRGFGLFSGRSGLAGFRGLEPRSEEGYKSLASKFRSLVVQPFGTVLRPPPSSGAAFFFGSSYSIIILWNSARKPNDVRAVVDLRHRLVHVRLPEHAFVDVGTGDKITLDPYKPPI